MRWRQSFPAASSMPVSAMLGGAVNLTRTTSLRGWAGVVVRAAPGSAGPWHYGAGS